MKPEPGVRESERERESERAGDARWRPVYAAVVAFTVLVIAALWWFSRAFSS